MNTNKKVKKYGQRQVFERYLSEKEESVLFKSVKSFGSVLARRDHAWMLLLRHTGIRVGSLALLTLDDALLARTSGYLVLRDEIAKGERGYKVYLNKTATLALKRLLRIRKEMGAPTAPDSPFILSRHHGGLAVRSFQQRMQHWSRVAGLRVVASPHWWRHTLAKRLMKSSEAADPRGHVCAVLGHSSVVSTTVYTLPDREDIERSLEGVS
ncbi:MAG: recombinase XerC [Cycloclasticus sp.]|nr:MAG: recombinase XerC [Cycloclasticus sp.]